ncbi:MAG: RpiB/LacA/LacB family sugar-phosphate isomerase [Candidatus Micrarchaeota archaeon]
MIYLGSDHAGFKLKKSIVEWLSKKKIVFQDLGVSSETKKVDYPDYAFAVGRKVTEKKALGILVCGTGAGVCIAANKVKGVRAVLVYSNQEAKNAKIHNNANVLCFNAYKTKPKNAFGMINAWLDAKFDSSERRVKRLKKISRFESKWLK